MIIPRMQPIVVPRMAPIAFAFRHRSMKAMGRTAEPMKTPMNAVLALDSSALDIDQVENLTKLSYKRRNEPIKKKKKEEEMTMLKFLLELMNILRVESKLRVFAFRITFSSQVNDLRCNLSTINAAASKRICKIASSNADNSRFRKCIEPRHCLRLIAEKMPELLDFDKDLVHLEAASKIQLKSLAEEMQAVSKGLEKVEQELTTSENDGAISTGFQKALKNFLDTVEAEVRSLISMYSEVGRSADSLSQYFGEDPARCPFEQVTQILAIFVKMLNKARDENEQQADAEKKKLEKEVMKELVTAQFANDHSKPNFRIQKHAP
ncbi:unnamed protein product [Camellia sinensis]